MAADERTVREQKRATALVCQFGISMTPAAAIARAELEREGRLVATIQRDLEAFNCSGHPLNARRVREAIAAYEAEFAPPKRTLAEVAKDVVADRAPIRPHPEDDRNDAVSARLLDELSEALRREGGA